MSRIRNIGWLLTFVLVACAPVAQEKEAKRYFWPPYTTDPKIEYIGFAQSTHDVTEPWSDWVQATIAGIKPPQPLFGSPQHVAVSEQGKVYVTDRAEGVVKVLDYANKQVYLLQDANQSKDAQIAAPNGIDVDADGNVYVVDALRRAIIVFDSNDRYLYAFGSKDLNRPLGIAVDLARERAYVVDPGLHSVFVYALSGEHIATIGSRGVGPAQFNFPLDVDLDLEGNLYVLDSLNARVQVLSPDGDFLREFGERGTAKGSFKRAKSITVSGFGHVYVTDALDNKFVIFDTQGNFLLNVGGYYKAKKGVSPGGFYFPSGIDVDSKGSIWVVDVMNRVLHNFQYLSEEYLSKHPIQVRSN